MQTRSERHLRRPTLVYRRQPFRHAQDAERLVGQGQAPEARLPRRQMRHVVYDRETGLRVER